MPSYADWYKTTTPATYDYPPHIQFICEEIVQKVLDGDLKRVILSMPPQHGKSDTITRRLPVYWIEGHPGANVLLTGYNQTFANKKLSKPARDIARQRGLLAADATAMDDWETVNGGLVSARGVGNPPTGTGYQLVIIDDPIKSREEANSEIIRESIWEWYTGSIIQRFWPETIVIVIATRWHEDDLIGRLIAHDDSWTVINLASIADTEGDAMGRAVGEALWPDGRPVEFLESQKLAMGEYDFEALYQGNPTPKDGALFKVGNIGWVSPKDVPEVDSVLSFDLGAATKGDFTFACQGWRCAVSNRFYFDFSFIQAEPFERNKWMRTQADMRQPRLVRGPQDPGAAGKEAAQAFVRLMVGHNVRTETVKGDKEMRAEPLAAQVNAGMVFFVDSPGSRKAYEQFRQFPGGKHDDAIDAGADTFVELLKASSSGPQRVLRKGGYV